MKPTIKLGFPRVINNNEITFYFLKMSITNNNISAITYLSLKNLILLLNAYILKKAVLLMELNIKISTNQR